MTTTKNADDVLRHMAVIERMVMDIIEVASKEWGDKHFPLVLSVFRTMNAAPEVYVGLDRAEILQRLIENAFPLEDTDLIVRSIKQKYGI